MIFTIIWIRTASNNLLHDPLFIMIIHYAVASVQGSDHEVNTDQFILCLGDRPILKGGSMKEHGKLKQSGLLFSVGNGVHAGAVGLECAESSMNEFQTLLEGVDDYQSFRLADGKSRLDEGMRRVHELLLQLTETKEDGVQMMACVAAMWFCQDYAVFSQVGNTRIYQFEDRVLELLSEDNTEAWELVKAGKISPDKVHTYPGQKVLTQVMGGKGKQKPVIEIKSVKIEPNDVYLMCTAGLIEGISHQEMEEMMLGAVDSKGVIDSSIAERIVEFSTKANGKNNATAVICQVFPDQSMWTSMIRNLR